MPSSHTDHRKRKNSNILSDMPISSALGKLAPYTPLLLDWPLALSLVYGGCCTNAWALERLLAHSKTVGTAVTFLQMAFTSLQGAPSFLVFKSTFPFIELRPRTVPIRVWTLQVVVLWVMSLLNNWAFAYDVPLAVQIVFRSGGLAVSMLFGYFLLSQRYNLLQVSSVLAVSSGVILTTISRPSPSAGSAESHRDPKEYFLGIVLLTVSLLLTGYLGYLQEGTYKKYGPCWKEGLFYTHFLSLPLFLPLTPSISQGINTLLHKSAYHTVFQIPLAFTVLPLNLFSQFACVAGVNMLTARLSSVSTNLILTSRKALSLALSVWWFGSAWNTGMSIGSAMVGAGTVAYAWGGSKAKEKSKSQKKE